MTQTHTHTNIYPIFRDKLSLVKRAYSCGVVLVFWFWWEMVFGVTYILSVQYSCAVVSVFWLWREIVLKMRTPFEFLLGYFIMIRYPMCIFHKT